MYNMEWLTTTYAITIVEIMIKTKQDKFNKVNTKAKIKRKKIVTQEPLEVSLLVSFFVASFIKYGVPCIFEKTLVLIKKTLLHFSGPAVRNV